MPLDSTKFRLGPSNIYLWETSAWVLIGYVDNGEITFSPQRVNLLGGQNGTSPIDIVITGMEGHVAFDCQQIELKNWQRALLGNTQKFQGVTTPANHRLEFQTKAGNSLRAISTKVKVVPIVGGVETTNVEEIFVGEFAVPTTDTVSAAFSNTTQRTIHMEFGLLADDTKRNRLGYMGDDTADTSAAGTW